MAAVTLSYRPCQEQDGIKTHSEQSHPSTSGRRTQSARYFHGPLPSQSPYGVPPPTSYSGSPIPAPIDEDIHLHEVTAALVKVCRNRAPGMNQIPMKAPATIDSPFLLELTDYFNHIWPMGVLPEE
ncbi:hypothetical protein HPB48_004879 [Haemaphysalis longicornis]|uniref:Uncharacterized protein n=1 Tax=Haemaphysalis longicornis TaxID=44386 RepID=A0A9J6H3P3_HAELO|nr:hypothetical protein HPB48_004879 [Haemaphysalis longicornis]